MAGISAKMEIQGLDELAKKLEPDRLINPATQNLLTRAALVVEKQAKLNASGRPGPMVQTGRLRSSITHWVEPTYAKVGTNVEYASFLEFGTERMPSYPFLNPALEQSKSEIGNLLTEAAKQIEDNYKK